MDDDVEGLRTRLADLSVQMNDCILSHQLLQREATAISEKIMELREPEAGRGALLISLRIPRKVLNAYRNKYGTEWRDHMKIVLEKYADAP
jgi:uncharacterized protein (DUF4415 family)